MATNRKQKARAAEQYADAVVAVLTPEFPDLNESHIRAFVAGEITEYVTSHSGVLDVALDDAPPVRWRLRDDRDQPPGRIRLACRRSDASGADRAREDRINAALREIA